MPAKTPRMKPRKDGRMQKSLTIGRNPDGSYRRKTIYGKTQKEVNEKAAELMVQLRLGTYTDSDRTTFREVGEMWIANYKSAVSEGAHNRYDRIMRNHLFPELGAMRLKELKPFHLTSIINRCAAEGYASRTMAEIKHTASQILDAAVENDILFRNVFEKVKIPKVPANERRALTEEELSFITSTWQEHRMGLPVLIMAYCGLRRGEMLALTWSDIDMVKCEISVSKSVCMSGSKLEIKSPKSKAGTRIVPMPDVLIDAIKQVQKTSLYVCPDAKGRVMSQSAYTCAWRSYLHFLNIKAGGRDATRNKPKVLAFAEITAHMGKHCVQRVLQPYVAQPAKYVFHFVVGSKQHQRMPTSSRDQFPDLVRSRFSKQFSIAARGHVLG